MKKIIDTKYESVRISELHNRILSGEIDLNPEWQRRDVWCMKEEKVSKLVESVFMGAPIPTIILLKTDTWKYRVVDGKQRLSSLSNFMLDKIKLKNIGAHHIDEDGVRYLKKSFSELHEISRRRLENASLEIATVTITNTKDIVNGEDLILSDIFERLNTSGMGLTPMEIRNCIFQNTNLMRFIDKLSKYELFSKLMGRSKPDDRMDDCEEVLRFLAFYDVHYKNIRQPSVKPFLDYFCEYNQTLTEDKQKILQNKFHDAVELSRFVFGDNNAFRVLQKPNSKSSNTTKYSTMHNKNVQQVVMSSLVIHDKNKIREKASEIYQAYDNLMKNDHNWVGNITSMGTKLKIRDACDVWHNVLNNVVNS